MKTVGVFVKPTENLSEPLEHLVSVLRRAGCKVLLEERAAQALGNPDGASLALSWDLAGDVAVVLGGGWNIAWCRSTDCGFPLSVDWCKCRSSSSHRRCA